MKKTLLCLACSVLFFSCEEEQKKDISADSNENFEVSAEDTIVKPAIIDESEKTIYSVTTIENGPENWGYQVLNNGQVFINQPHIPAVPGKNGFISEEEAKRVGDLVITKLEAGALPPTVTKEELDSLKIQYNNPF